MIRVDSPAVISFSGGRTSGYMLRRALDGGLDGDVHVLFANTGCEMPQTLDFVAECATRWGVKIHWLEYDLTDTDEPTFREVNYFNASREAEPFTLYLDHLERLKKAEGEPMYLPGPAGRYCSTELKTRVIRRWMVSKGYEHWTSVVGIRFDEPKRWVGKNKTPPERWELDWPLVDSKTTKADVMLFWSQQPFDLQLTGEWEGNCDACVIKADWKVVEVFRAHPERARWWLKQEERAGKRFRTNGLSVRELFALSKTAISVQKPAEEVECAVCVD